MIQIPFYTTEEKSPSHNQFIIILVGRTSFDMTGFEPRQVNVEYSWEGYDNEGEHTGTSACFNAETESHKKLGDLVLFGLDLGTTYKLEWQADGLRSEDIAFWVPEEEYWEALE